MDTRLEGPVTAGWAKESGDDTVEIQLTAEQQLLLSQAARAAAELTSRTAEPTSRAAQPVRDSFLYRRMARVDLVCNVMFAAAVFVIGGAAVWRAASQHTRAPALPPPPRAVVVAVPTAPIPAQQPLVQVRNPFDPAEVFEFPAATTAGQAREAMAEQLLQRARERLAQGVVSRHARIDSPMDERARSTVQAPPEILVNTSYDRAN